ncbi:unnamed protein product [Rotaria magnacalcarata]|uniref:Uncharacterized protein n=1 Tax=Rotaria magnacalcarata TaxID=392030 RepID=A0A815W5L5_9BILA|nr:unnamed protein product [Rotaria magnacalcarata]
MDNESEDSIVSTSSIEAEQEIMAHGVKHGHSYVSQQCTINLVKALFKSSSTVAKSLSCAKTKSRAIACNVLAPYFTCLIDFLKDSREAALDIFKNIIKVIDDHQLNINNLTSIGADNANVNFGEYHSVFKLLKDRLPHILKGNCYAHVLHNGIQHAHDVLKKNVLVDIQQAELNLQRTWTTAVDLIVSLPI